MARRIAQRELRNHNATIMDAVAQGDSFILTRDGTPIAELRPPAGGRRRMVPRAEVTAVAAQGPHLDATVFRADFDGAREQRLSR